MESLANYGSEDELENDNLDKIRDVTSTLNNRRVAAGSSYSNANYKKIDDTNYEHVQMELSEDSDDGSTSNNDRQNKKRDQVKDISSTINDKQSSRTYEKNQDDEPLSKKNRERNKSKDRESEKRDSKGHDRDSRDRYSSSKKYRDERDDRYKRDSKPKGEKEDYYRDRERDKNRKRDRDDDRERDRIREREKEREREKDREREKEKERERERNRQRERNKERDRERERERERERDRQRDRNRLSGQEYRRLPSSPQNDKKERKDSNSRCSPLPPSPKEQNPSSLLPLSTGTTNNNFNFIEKRKEKVLQLEKMGIDISNNTRKPGVELPSYYNPGVINPTKYADQVQKRKLLWANKKLEQEQAAKWESAKFSQDQDGKVASKFMRLMGIKDAPPKPPQSEATVRGPDLTKKQEELFSTMEQQYEVARQVTHTMRGVGLGFGSQQPRQF